MKTAIVSCCLCALIFGCKPGPRESRETRRILVESEVLTDLFATGNTYFVCTDGTEDHYARGGRLAIGEFGELELSSGNQSLPFTPVITVPSDSKLVWIDHSGEVYIRQTGSADAIAIGTVVCCRFHAGRLISSKLCGFYRSSAPPKTGNFGEMPNAHILTGWRAIDDPK